MRLSAEELENLMKKIYDGELPFASPEALQHALMALRKAWHRLRKASA